jgi:glycosyltransferase involved in cell wall biosynthesis
VGVTARVFLLPVLKRLQEEGYQVWLACTDDDDARYVAAAGIPFYPVTISRKISLRDIVSTWRLYRLIRKHKFDVVNTHTAKAGFTGRLAAWLARVPCIIHTAHGLTIHEYLSRPVRAFYAFLERWIGKRTTAFITVTDKIRNDLVSHGISQPDNTCRIYNGIDFSLFPGSSDAHTVRSGWDIPENAVVVGAVSRLVPDKGLEDLLDAFARLNTEFPDAVLVIAGDGELRSALETRASDAGTSGNIRFLGWRNDIPAVMSGFDIFCLPTLREGFGYVFLEAQAMGTPVVATKIDPLTETMADAAVFVSPHSPAELSRALSNLISDTDHRNRLAIAGRQRVREKFDQRNQLDEIVELYGKLLDEA